MGLEESLAFIEELKPNPNLNADPNSDPNPNPWYLISKLNPNPNLDRGVGIYSHMGLEESLSFIEELKPSVAYLTGTF
jgi:hypothetical protein